MFFSTTLVDFLRQAVQKFQETAKKFDEYVEKADKEEYVYVLIVLNSLELIG